MLMENCEDYKKYLLVICRYKIYVTVHRQCHLLKKVIRKNIFNNLFDRLYSGGEL